MEEPEGRPWRPRDTETAGGGFLMVLLLLPGPPGRPSHALLVRPWALGKPCSTISKDKIKNEKEHDV